MEAGLLRNKWFGVVVLGAAVLSLSSCTEYMPFSWGPYQDIAYHTMEGDVDPQEAIGRMEERLKRIDAAGDLRRIPPGFHAQLGYLYGKIGNVERMRAEFREESRIYPQSKKYMDFLLSTEKGKKKTEGNDEK